MKNVILQVQMIKNKHDPLQVLYDTKVFCSIPNLPYTVVGSSVSWKACNEVFLNGHIWLLDRQCHRKHATRFS